MTNFQVASSTLDASAKIYAGRVDAIHAETYKVLTGLGRGTDKNSKEQDDGDEVVEEEDSDGPPGAKKRKRARQGRTIETNLKNITVQRLELAFKTDPLFHKTSAAFDEGGTAGLLLNQLHCCNDMSELVLDSNTIVSTSDDQQMPSSHTEITKQQQVALKELKKMFLGLKLSSTFICPEFNEFEFSNYKSGDDTYMNSMLHQRKNSYAFDLNAEVDTIPESTDSEPLPDDIGDGFGAIEDDGDDHMSGNSGEEHNSSGQSIVIGDSKEAQMVKNTMNSIKHGTVGTLIQILATEPSDYSYFNSKLLQTWAGPAHWKLHPKSKDLPPVPVVRKKKEPLVIDFDEELNVEEHLKKKRAATELSNQTQQRWCKNQTLPEDLRYEEEDLFKLFIKPKLMVKRQKRHSTIDIDNEVEAYNYDNQNDVDNFCPEGDQADNNDDNENYGFDLTAGVTQSQDVLQSGDVIGKDGEIYDTDLVAQPRKIAKIDIGYAKTAKKMDIKKLKSSMWSLLTVPPSHSDSEEQEKIDEKVKEVETAGTSNGDRVNSKHSFKMVVKELPKKISKTMANNLSVPIAFVCLLHLANEKTLELKSNEDMDDLFISQG